MYIFRHLFTENVHAFRKVVKCTLKQYCIICTGACFLDMAYALLKHDKYKRFGFDV